MVVLFVDVLLVDVTAFFVAWLAVVLAWPTAFDLVVVDFVAGDTVLRDGGITSFSVDCGPATLSSPPG